MNNAKTSCWVVFSSKRDADVSKVSLLMIFLC